MSDSDLFKVEMVGSELPHDACIPALVAQAQRFAARGFTPSYGSGDHGNLSCRATQGMIITARESSKAQLRPEDFVSVIGCEERGPKPVMRAQGRRLPSTDAWLHWRIYAARPDAEVILHGHDTVALRLARALALPVTSISAAQPSVGLVEEATSLAMEHDYVLLREHGFLAVGSSLDEAVALVDRWAQQARGMK